MSCVYIYFSQYKNKITLSARDTLMKWNKCRNKELMPEKYSSLVTGSDCWMDLNLASFCTKTDGCLHRK